MENTQKKWVDLFLLFAATLLGYFVGILLEYVWVYMGISFHEDWPIQWPYIISFSVALLGLVIVRKNDSIATFLAEVAFELNKVAWPGSKDVGVSTVVVIAMVAIATVVLFLYDWVLGLVSRWMFNF